MPLPTILLPTAKSYSARCVTGPHPCIICGRDLERPTRWIHVVDGGRAVFDPHEEYADEAADLGFHPVGSECLKNFPQLKPYVVRDSE